MVDYLGAKAHVDPVGGVRKHEGAQAAQQAFKNGHRHQSDAQNLEGVEAALGNHFVDDHLN